LAFVEGCCEIQAGIEEDCPRKDPGTGRHSALGAKLHASRPGNQHSDRSIGRSISTSRQELEFRAVIRPLCNSPARLAIAGPGPFELSIRAAYQGHIARAAAVLLLAAVRVPLLIGPIA
jgi:hypothetical protein